MLPRISIKYLNGLLGTVPESQDGLLALTLIGASAVADTFVLGEAYKIYSPSSLENLGVTEENNARLVEIVRDFYNEAAEGTPMIVAGYADQTMDTLCNKDTGPLKTLMESQKGAIRGIVVAKVMTKGAETADGLTKEVGAAVAPAQLLAEWSATSLFAPVFVVLEGCGFTKAADLKDYTDAGYNRVMIVVGDTKASSSQAAVGVLAGKIAASAVQENIGAVRVGALSPVSMYLGASLVDRSMDDVNTAHDKGYVTTRVWVGRAGYYYTDDCMLCDKTDDYAHLTARRTVDKAARIAYNTLLDYMLDPIEINEDGTMQAPVIKSWQASVVGAVDSQMTAAGELSSVGGSGCQCLIDAKQNVLATSKVSVVLKVRPFAYAREIDVELGFLVAAN